MKILTYVAGANPIEMINKLLTAINDAFFLSFINKSKNKRINIYEDAYFMPKTVNKELPNVELYSEKKGR